MKRALLTAALVLSFCGAAWGSGTELDSSFDLDGLVTTAFAGGNGNLATAVAIDANGNVVVAGFSNKSGTVGMAVARYKPDGTLDPSFGSGGSFIFNYFGGTTDDVFAMTFQPDGKILLAGSTTDRTQTTTPPYTSFALARLLPNGSLDSNIFGNMRPGRSESSSWDGTDQTATGVAVQSDGKILVGGSVDGFFAIARFFSDGPGGQTDGSLDPSWGSSGTGMVKYGHIITNSSDTVNTMLLQPDGKILLAGYSRAPNASNTASVIIRLKPDSTADTSFGSGGLVLGDLGEVKALAVQPDGKIIAVGNSTAQSSPKFMVTRYKSDGTLDAGFGSNGSITTQFSANNAAITSAVVLQPDGKIVAVGYSNNQFALARYNTNGTLDSTFGAGGLLKTVFPSPGNIQAAYGAVGQSDGKIVAVGYSASVSQSDFAVARYMGTSCGNGQIGFGEDCEGTNLNGKTCSTQGFLRGTLACKSDCTFDTGRCSGVTALCGNNTVDSGEYCDGADLNGKTCQVFGFTGGTLNCNTDCTINPTGCVGRIADCGNGTIDPGESCDLTQLNNETCSSQGFTGGTLKCGYDCKLDSSKCIGVHISPSGDDFGNQAVGRKTSARTFTVDADVTMQTAVVLGAVTASNQGEFVVSNNKCSSQLLNPGGSCTFDVSFSPNAIGSRDTVLKLAINPSVVGLESQSVSLIGAGIQGSGNCGNGVIEADELCDGTNLNGQTCPSLSSAFNGGTLTCSSSCTFDLTACSSSTTCINGKTETGEDCDKGEKTPASSGGCSLIPNSR